MAKDLVLHEDVKLGKKDASGGVHMLATDFIDFSALPKHPTTFGHDTAVKAPWQMLGNDDYGDCVFAGAGHEHMVWGMEQGKNITFSADSVLKAYSEVTGFNPKDPNTDQGTDMSVAAAYRRKTGIPDASGARHQVAAYLALTPGNWDQMLAAAWLFGAVGIGIQFPSSAMDQFNANKNWSVVRGASIEGGHYIPVVAKHSTLQIVTWGREIGMTEGFYKKYCDEAIVYLSADTLNPAGSSPEGFNRDQLIADLAALH